MKIGYALPMIVLPRPNVPFGMVWRQAPIAQNLMLYVHSSSFCVKLQSVSPKRWNKTGSFVWLAFVCRLCCVFQMFTDLVRWVRYLIIPLLFSSIIFCLVDIAGILKRKFYSLFLGLHTPQLHRPYVLKV